MLSLSPLSAAPLSASSALPFAIADSGVFSLGGESATLSVEKVAPADAGSLVLTGQTAGLSRWRPIAAGAGSIALSGQSATLLKGRVLQVDTGTFALTGQSITWTKVDGQLGKSSVSTFPSPTNANGQIDANTVRTNDNLISEALNSHDGNAAIHVQSGTLALRPASLPNGGMYFGTDTGDLYFYANSAWVTIGGASRYGAWSDYTDQTTAAANTATLMTFNTVDVESGALLVSSSRMTAAYTGVYNFQWSGQFTNTDAAEQDVDIWIRINGSDVTGSSGRVSVPKRHGSIDGHVLPGWNYYLTLNANDYVQLYWAATNTSVSLQTTAAASPRPSTASLIATMAKV